MKRKEQTETFIDDLKLKKSFVFGLYKHISAL